MKRMYPASLLVIALSLSACATRPPDLAASPTPTAAQPQPSAAPFAADQTRMIPVQGGQVFVRINGRLDADRPPVVFIHGGPGGTHHGFVQALPLADERAVILYDQLDTGASDRPGDRGPQPGNDVWAGLEPPFSAPDTGRPASSNRLDTSVFTGPS